MRDVDLASPSTEIPTPVAGCPVATALEETAPIDEPRQDARTRVGFFSSYLVWRRSRNRPANLERQLAGSRGLGTLRWPARTARRPAAGNRAGPSLALPRRAPRLGSNGVAPAPAACAARRVGARAGPGPRGARSRAACPPAGAPRRSADPADHAPTAIAPTTCRKNSAPNSPPTTSAAPPTSSRSDVPRAGTTRANIGAAGTGVASFIHRVRRRRCHPIRFAASLTRSPVARTSAINFARCSAETSAHILRDLIWSAQRLHVGCRDAGLRELGRGGKVQYNHLPSAIATPCRRRV